MQSENDPLRDKVVVITGGSTGIGAATARRLDKRGAYVVLVARDKVRLESVRATLSERARIFVADVCVQGDMDGLTKFAMEAHGRVDVLFANAGAFITGDLADGNPDAWEKGIDVNVTAVCRTIRAFAADMIRRRDGHIVITASVAGRWWMERQTVYCATKRAVYGIAEGLRHEMLPHDVRVTLISPGWVASEFWEGTRTEKGVAAALEDMRAIESDDIARSVEFVLEQPKRVNISEMVIRPLRQKH